ncbi:cobalt-zinc-cadmium efflux system membrane fusion protein [Oxalobacteraceae bacterium GrIS 1.11]
MTIPNKKHLGVAAIVLAGALLAALILGGGPAAPSAEATAPHLEEGKLALSDAQIAAAAITVANAGPDRIETSLALAGEIALDAERTAHIVPRLAGVVDSVHVKLGQPVKQGQLLAVISSPALSEQRSQLLSAQKNLALARATHQREGMLWREKISAEQDYLQAGLALHEAEIAVRNASQKLAALGAGSGRAQALNQYEIRAPFDATVLEKHIAPGEAVQENSAIFTLADLATVWAEIAVPARDLNSVKVGARALVKANAADPGVAGVIAYVGAQLGAQNRSATARVRLANPALAWRPGLFVTVAIATGAVDAAVTVTAEAVHTIEERPSVFVKVAGGFQASPVTLGRADGKLVEITHGLAAGAPYAAAGSFTLKSELGKAGAGHEH